MFVPNWTSVRVYDPETLFSLFVLLHAVGLQSAVDIILSSVYDNSAKAIPVGNEAGTVPSRTAMDDHGK